MTTAYLGYEVSPAFQGIRLWANRSHAEAKSVVPVVEVAAEPHVDPDVLAKKKVGGVAFGPHDKSYRELRPLLGIVE